jgi:ABC-type nitrate/sulfonate/bicarbonate transport system permease component
MPTSKENKFRSENVIAPVITFIIIFGGLELIVRGFNISRQILPAPSAIVVALVNNFFSDLGEHFLLTIFEILTGFVVGVPLGIAFAALLSQNKLLLKAFSPYVIFLVTTPMLTLVPLFMMWLGFGGKARILVVILQTIPIVTLNSITGFNSVEKFKLNLARSLGATKNQTFFKVIFPNAMPQVFTGIKLGAIFATIAALGAQFAGARNGLGNRIIYYSRLIQTETAFASIVLVAIIGISMYMIISRVERHVVKWKNY